MKKNVEMTERLVENHLIGDLIMEGTEFEGPKATKLKPNKVGDYTGGEFKQAQLDGIITEEEIAHL
jgi:hypothetical protein